ncbi:hypothetical protein FHR47_000301 [Xanthomonas arboricola]|nr:hypothetical protein [Xanthomonas cannabis]
MQDTRKFVAKKSPGMPGPFYFKPKTYLATTRTISRHLLE